MARSPNHFRTELRAETRPAMTFQNVITSINLNCGLSVVLRELAPIDRPGVDRSLLSHGNVDVTCNIQSFGAGQEADLVET